MQTVCRYEFPDEVKPLTIEAHIARAIIVAEFVFGKPKVRVSAAYLMSKTERRAVIDVSTEVGEFIAVVFTGLMMRELGENNFQVDRVHEKERSQESPEECPCT